MKLRHYKKAFNTYLTCIRYCKCQSESNKRGLVAVLKRWAKSTNDGKLEDYGYTGNVLDHLSYCSDRMNRGRALALLRLLKEENKS